MLILMRFDLEIWDFPPKREPVNLKGSHQKRPLISGIRGKQDVRLKKRNL